MTGYIQGVNLLPASGEWTYDTVQHQLITQWLSTPTYVGSPPVLENVWTPLTYQVDNYYSDPAGSVTDYSTAIGQLQADLPGCTTAALVCAWFGNSRDITACQIYPSTNHNGAMYTPAIGNTYTTWTVSSLYGSNPLEYDAYGNITQPPTPFPGIIPISKPDGIHAVYGGTPSDQSVVRCIQDLKSRGFRVVFYPFLLIDIPNDFPWRGRIGYNSPDISAGATTAINNFLGSAAISDFAQDPTNLTVSYSGSPTDYTYRRMILHYANLCCVAGGVDLFLVGSELHDLEIIRGPGWTPAGTTDGSGNAIWDYPFVAGLNTLIDDCRTIFDNAGLAKDLTGLHNLITYSPDWSNWLGVQQPTIPVQNNVAYPATDGQWPHLDQLYANPNVDIVSFDNYMPLSDWTTGTGGLDVIYWSEPAPTGPWPPSTSTMNGLGLTGEPTIYSIPYLKANIEGGEKFNWYYNDSNNLGRGLDPNGTDLQVSTCNGDRVIQYRQPYAPNQELLANKQLRWFWSNLHYAIYDAGSGWVPQGPKTQWVPQSKQITFGEYGYPSCDRATNQPNLFYDSKSTESGTPYWSIWDSVDGGGYAPQRDQQIMLLALQAMYEYWVTDGNGMQNGVQMFQPAFFDVWNWDVRPFPTFPILTDVWGDAGNWPAGDWLGGKGPFIPVVTADPPPSPGTWPAFPTLPGQGWSVHYRPQYETGVAEHVSGRQSRFAHMSLPLFEIQITFDILRMDAPYTELQTFLGFVEERYGADLPFTFPAPTEFGLGATFTCRFADDAEDLEEFMSRLWQIRAVMLRTVKGE